MNPGFDAHIQDMARRYAFPEPVYVTRPNLPPLQTFMEQLEPAWAREWLTNDGCLHARLESELTTLLDVPYLRLFCNGTIALLTALQALQLDAGEVITTPFTFPATINTLYWNRLRPVFCDIDPYHCNLDPDHLAALVTKETRAILPVHVYGVPCDVERIQAVADAHGLPVIYDAAHAFGVRYKGRSILRHGVVSMLSFHATKLFTTAEGGALATGDPALYERIRLLKNFGIADEETVIAPGINGKMNELQAALGLAQMNTVTNEIEQRRRIADVYCSRLAQEPGVRLPGVIPEVERNYAYFPVQLDPALFGLERDALYTALKIFNVHCRKYFHPLCSTYHWCHAEPGALPVAEAVARRILCLPIYGSLPLESVETICTIITELGVTARA